MIGSLCMHRAHTTRIPHRCSSSRAFHSLYSSTGQRCCKETSGAKTSRTAELWFP